MAITERDAQRAIDRALRDVRSTSFTHATRARGDLVSEFQEITREFIEECRRVTRKNVPMSSAERDAIYTLMLIALARIRVAYLTAGEAGMELVPYIVTRLQSAHASIVFQAAGTTQRNAANDAFTRLLRTVDQQVQQDLRSQRRNSLSLEVIVETNVQSAIAASAELLDAARDADIDADSVASDLAFLLLGNDIDYATYNVDRPVSTPLRMLLFSATMLALSETFNAMRSAQAEVLKRLNLVETGRWTLSGKHANLSSSPDACDGLANQNVGFGAGRYPVAGWPQAPHPHCACYMSKPQWQNFRAWLSQWP